MKNQYKGFISTVSSEELARAKAEAQYPWSMIDWVGVGGVEISEQDENLAIALQSEKAVVARNRLVKMFIEEANNLAERGHVGTVAIALLGAAAAFSRSLLVDHYGELLTTNKKGLVLSTFKSFLEESNNDTVFVYTKCLSFEHQSPYLAKEGLVAWIKLFNLAKTAMMKLSRQGGECTDFTTALAFITTVLALLEAAARYNRFCLLSIVEPLSEDHINRLVARMSGCLDALQPEKPFVNFLSTRGKGKRPVFA